MKKIILKDYQENPIHVYIYEPEQALKGIVHIIHGAAEHFARYGLFAEFLNQNGYAVIGCDILGHGLSTSTLDYVHFADKDGDILAYESIVLVKEYIEQNYPDLKRYVIGHSMGSFLARKLVLDFPDFYEKAIFSGSGYTSKALLVMAGILIGLIKLFKGPRYVSRFIQNMAIDSYAIKMRKDGIIKGIDEEWLTRDEEIQQYYHNSNMCGQPFTIQANLDLSRWVAFVNNKKNIAQGNKQMPIYFMSGDKDAVSNYGKEIKQVYEIFKSLGYEHVQMKLYADDRHEILNELNKDEVYQDMLKFLNA